MPDQTQAAIAQARAFLRDGSRMTEADRRAMYAIVKPFIAKLEGDRHGKASSPSKPAR